EAEQHREEEDGDPTLDLRELVQREERLSESPLEEHDQHPVARADREQVQQDGLERQQDRTEGAHQHQVREHQYGQHEPGEIRVRLREKSTPCGGPPPASTRTSAGKPAAGTMLSRSRWT